MFHKLLRLISNPRCYKTDVKVKISELISSVQFTVYYPCYTLTLTMNTMAALQHNASLTSVACTKLPSVFMQLLNNTKYRSNLLMFVELIEKLRFKITAMLLHLCSVILSEAHDTEVL